MIRNERDFERHCDYIHYNPVRHGLAACPHAWPHSTFRRFVDRGFYEPQWLCVCNGRAVKAPQFDDLAKTAPE
jgi:putative transposase